MAENMGRAFDREQCVFYDPEVNDGLGGPNPDRNLRGFVKTVNPGAKRPYRERFIRMRRRKRRGLKIEDRQKFQDRRKRRSEELDLDTEDLEVEPEDLGLLDSECDGTESGTGASFCETSMTHMRVSLSFVNQSEALIKKIRPVSFKMVQDNAFEKRNG